MPHPTHPTQPQQSLSLAISKTCPPGKGMVWLDLLRLLSPRVTGGM